MCGRSTLVAGVKLRLTDDGFSVDSDLEDGTSLCGLRKRRLRKVLLAHVGKCMNASDDVPRRGVRVSASSRISSAVCKKQHNGQIFRRKMN